LVGAELYFSSLFKFADSEYLSAMPARLRYIVLLFATLAFAIWLYLNGDPVAAFAVSAASVFWWSVDQLFPRRKRR